MKPLSLVPLVMLLTAPAAAQAPAADASSLGAYAGGQAAWRKGQTNEAIALLSKVPMTLLGTTSGGGSGRMTGYELPYTGLTLSICQMASFRANGDLFDGRGVAPDVVLESRPEDHLANGGDSVLEAALHRLRRTK